MSQINLQHETTTDRGEEEEWKTRVKTDMLRSIGKTVRSSDGISSFRFVDWPRLKKN